MDPGLHHSDGRKDCEHAVFDHEVDTEHIADRQNLFNNPLHDLLESLLNDTTSEG